MKIDLKSASASAKRIVYSLVGGLALYSTVMVKTAMKSRENGKFITNAQKVLTPTEFYKMEFLAKKNNL